ncbi:flavin reductase [Nocardioides marmoriginsengisoli]|uniref:Flavin reductase n=1 Tax=Nocardioides marmoriginsengisoli TaxID=661483 RepID=A0A3N0CLA9_9ACTN|nr:flavin reductase [Nocardioides marmoriginsengisoli]RNL64220.1 flavin reductase [Nocardioides marmoriginsengisoli]
MTIHSTNPFAEPPDPVRRFRGRLGGAVSLWTAGSGADRVGLTVSSLMVANGDPGRILGLLDPDAALTEALAPGGRAVVQLLTWADRDLAEAFAGTAPAPGGPFRTGEWEQTEHGPVLADRTRALVRVEELREEAWSQLVVTSIEDLLIVDDESPLEHRRGRYRTIP